MLAYLTEAQVQLWLYTYKTYKLASQCFKIKPLVTLCSQSNLIMYSGVMHAKLTHNQLTASYSYNRLEFSSPSITQIYLALLVRTSFVLNFSLHYVKWHLSHITFDRIFSTDLASYPIVLSKCAFKKGTSNNQLYCHSCKILVDYTSTCFYHSIYLIQNYASVFDSIDVAWSGLGPGYYKGYYYMKTEVM